MDNHDLQTLATGHGFSLSAVQHLYQALIKGNGTMAQFSHPELGGNGQWMSGGMIMIGDMFNHGLKARVDALCNDLYGQLQTAPPRDSSPAFTPLSRFPDSPWPAEWGQPTVSGGQNDLAYAYFPIQHRLAVRYGGRMTVFDTTGFAIAGFSQQQQLGLQGLYANSPQGLIAVMALPVVETRTP